MGFLWEPSAGIAAGVRATVFGGWGGPRTCVQATDWSGQTPRSQGPRPKDLIYLYKFIDIFHIIYELLDNS